MSANLPPADQAANLTTPRGVLDGDLVRLESRSGDVALHARISDRMQPREVYTTPRPAQRHHHRLHGLGHQLPGIQGDRGAGPQNNRISDWQVRFFDEDTALTRVAAPMKAAE